ncbi:hypothetical protein TSUD_60010 [Trifolium subterraneum]|uniref:Reverse transcriptase zinc-binding domain-containing protein n=1 Tax=Trifolium subterraneum TaxID=3900 RepID=A0A2Z6NT59_TRISU|nr:hypothetical protein TSUD_60010 [Trifolium subterraneum]
MISPIWYRVSRWVGIEYVSPNSIMQIFESFLGLGVGRQVRLGLILVWHAVVWTIWNSRNDIIFAGGSSTIDILVDKVKLYSWKWFLGKNPDSPCSLYEWEVQPRLCGLARQCEVVMLGSLRFWLCVIPWGVLL